MADARTIASFLDQIADGDADAFRRLCLMLWTPLLASATAALGAVHAEPVAAATFLEIWHLARHHRTDDPNRWLYEILARRTVDRLIAGHHDDPAREVCDRLAVRELANVFDGRVYRLPFPR